MKNKILTTALCSSALLLTACGGSSDSSSVNTPSNSITSNVDYSKSTTVDMITAPMADLAVSTTNSLIDIANIAEEISYSSSATCESGTIQKNSNGTVTLNNCKNVRMGGAIYPNSEGLTLSGTINSKITDTDTTEQYNVTLTSFSVKNSDNEITTYNGNVIMKHTHLSNNDVKSEYTVGKVELSWADNTDKEQYILSDYQLTETHTASSTPAKAKGKLQGDVNGKKFSVNFDSDVEYSVQYTPPTYLETIQEIKSATINIQDTTNNKNAISIKNTTGGKALISVFANGTSVSGYPKTVDWTYFE